MSSWKDVWRVTCSLLTPRFSQTISITRSSTEGTTDSSQMLTAARRRPVAQPLRVIDLVSFQPAPTGYLCHPMRPLRIKLKQY